MARLWPLLIRITLLLIGVVSLQAYAVQEKSNSSAAARKSAIRDFAEHLSGIPVEYQADLLFSLLYQEPNALSQQLQITLLTELFERAPTAQNQTPVSEATMLRSSFSHSESSGLVHSSLRHTRHSGAHYLPAAEPITCSLMEVVATNISADSAYGLQG